MKILSVNVGKPKSYTLDGVTLETSMVKVSQPEIRINTLSIDGDEFKGKNIHGTPDAVVYAMSAKNYTYWSQFSGRTLACGHLGENLSLDTMDENDFYLGDEYQCGSASIRVTGMRYPCNRLNFVTGHAKMRDEFLNQNWPGIYFEVLVPGIVKPGDTLVLKTRIQKEITALDLFKALRAGEKKTLTSAQLTNLLNSPYLLEKYKVRLNRFSDLAN